MTEKLKKLILLLCLLSVNNLVVVNNSWAKDSQFQIKLKKISQQEDKKQVLADLSTLRKSSDSNAAEQVEIGLLEAKIFFTIHKYNEGIEVTTWARGIASKENFPELVAQANKMLGILLYYQGELKPALNAYQTSLAYYETNQEQTPNTFAIERANLLNNIALVYTSLGQANLALLTYQLAEPLYAQYGNEADKTDVRYNIAALHISLKRFDIAIDMLTVIVEKRLTFNDGHGVATARADLGIAYKDSGQLKLGKENILAALNYFKKHDYRHDIASQLHNMSEIHNDAFEIEQAIFYGKQAVLMSKEVGHQKAYAGSLQSLAKAYYYSGDLIKATSYIERSIEVGQKIDYQTLLTENLAISALINASKQEFVKALFEHQSYQKRYLLASNNLLNDKLAEFESEQLNQQIVQLEQQRKLQDLQSAKVEQQRNVIVLTLILVLVVVFFIYRRYLEKRLTTELELRVKQRTHELEDLTNELEKANQVKSQFLANMSHEIRTPLTAIVGHAEAIIHDEVDRDKVQQDIGVIHGNSLHLLELINEILDLSRIEANKFELEIQPFNLDELIQDLSQTFSTQAQQKQLTFSIDHHLTMPFIIRIDSLRLKQILLNLCANAIKFTEKGQVNLAITWKNEQLIFTVTDTGIGLSEAHLAQVFEMFTQADNSISRRFGGSGLGLSLSNQLAKLMSGKITAKSQLEQGSTFCLTLPCQHISNDSLHALQEAEPEIDNRALFKGKILLAEDHDDNRHLITRLLTSLGLEVVTAKNGKEAVHLCVEHQPNLVLLDIQMPEMDGVEAFKALRGLGCNQPIYALTANAMSHEISQYLALGFTGHLKKPIERKNFISTIARYFSAKNNSAINPHQYFSEEIQTENELLESAQDRLANVDLSDLIAEFKSNISDDKRELERYCEKGEIIKLAKVAHRLAGAAQMFGFSELNQAAKELETLIKKESHKEKANYSLISELTHCLVDEINLIEQE